MKITAKKQRTGLKLPHKEGKRIAQKVCKTPSYVSQVLAGKHFDLEILEYAAEVLNKDKAQLQQIKARIEKQLM